MCVFTPINYDRFVRGGCLHSYPAFSTSPSVMCASMPVCKVCGVALSGVALGHTRGDQEGQGADVNGIVPSTTACCLHPHIVYQCSEWN